MVIKKDAVVVKVNINELKPAKYNPRKDLKASDKEYQKILKSIEKFGYVMYVVINKDKTVIGGHQRLKVLKELGYTDIEVTQVDLNKTDEKALNLALNKIDGEWDMDMLTDIIKDLDSMGADILVTGFDIGEITDMITHIDDISDIISQSDKGVNTVADVNPVDEWTNMPEYSHNDETGVRDIIVHFASNEDVQEFANVIGQKITDKSKFIWFPPQTDDSHLGVYYDGEQKTQEE